MTFTFHSRVPRPPLDRVVAQLWWADGQIPYAADHLLPMPNAVLVVVLGDPFSTHTAGKRRAVHRRGWLTGPRQAAVVNRPLGRTRAVGAVFRTGGAAAVLGVPASVTTGAAIAIDDIVGAGAAARLRDDLHAAPGWQGELDRFEAFLQSRLDPELGRLRRVERAVTMLAAPARPSITGLAADLGITVQHLGREFRHWVGLSPGWIARLGRLHALLDAVDTRNAVPWGTLAFRFSYADQAHLSREFRALTGLTPTDYVRRRLAIYGPLPPGSQTLFVPLADDVQSVQDRGSSPA